MARRYFGYFAALCLGLFCIYANVTYAITLVSDYSIKPEDAWALYVGAIGLGIIVSFLLCETWTNMLWHIERSKYRMVKLNLPPEAAKQLVQTLADAQTEESNGEENV